MSWESVPDGLTPDASAYPSMRDEFAMAALPLVATFYGSYVTKPDAQYIAEEAYAIADAMLRQRKLGI